MNRITQLALALLLTLFPLTPFAGRAAQGATSVVVWGEGPKNTIPEGLTNVVKVTTGVRHCAALRSDGTVITWGTFDFTAPDEVVIPQPIGLSNVVAIASGKNHVLALKSDGTVVRWGRYRAELTAMPVGLSNVVAIAGGFDHSLALKADGTVVAWQTFENVVVPADLTNVVRIDATSSGGKALKQDGSLVTFDTDSFQVPASQLAGAPVIKVASQNGPTALLRADGTVISLSGPEYAPVTNLYGVKDLDVGAISILALRSDGTLHHFGSGDLIPDEIKNNNNFLGVSVHERSFIALLGDPVVAQPPQITQAPTNQTVMGGGTAVLTVSATGTPPLSYQWRKAGVPLAGQTASVLAISNVTVTAAGNYDVVVSGAGSVTSAPPAALTVLGPPIITSPAEVKGTAGVPLNYQITAIGNPTGFQAPGLPAGLTFNPSTGLISGAPAAGGQTDVTLVATNLYGAGFQTLTVKVRPVGTVVAWGSNTYGEGTVPADLTNVVTVSAGQFKSLALLNTGNVVEWGDTPALPPALGNVTAISAGFTHFLALLSNGTVVGGGGNAFGESTPPVGLTNVVSVTAGDQHSVALRQDGTVVAWGRGDFGQTNVPANLTNVIAIDAGGLYRTLALKADGTVVQWGSTSGIVIPPGLSNLVAIAAGDYHSLALRQDGTVVGWGFNDAGQTNIPVGLTNVVAIAAGSGHSLALKANGTVVAWGTNSYGQFPIPAALTNGSNVVLAIAARNGHSLAVVPNAAPEPPTITLPPQSQTVPAGGTPYLFVSAAGTPTLRYQWFKAGVPVGGATNALFGLPNIQPPQAGGYYVVVTNAYGAVTSSVATLTVNAPGTLLSQNFEGGTDLNLYQSLSAPTTAQFNSISGTAGAGALVMDIASQAGLGTSLVLSRPGAGSVSVVRTTDLAASVGAVVVQMRFTPGQIKSVANSVLSFQLGTNFSALSQAETGGQVAAQIAVDLRGPDTAGDQWGWTGSPTTFNGFASNAFPLVTWAVNNSGGPVSYLSPNGGNITLADGKSDLWVGDSGLAVRVFEGQANLNVGVPLRTFKIACNDGNASYGIDEFTITKVAAEAQPTLLFNTTPRSASTTNGGTVTLSALVTGTGSLTYQWLRNGSMVPGAAGSQLVLSNLSQFQEGLYSLNVTGLGGSITSRPSALVISLPAVSNSFAGSDGFDGAIRDTVNWGDFDFTRSSLNTVLIQETNRLVFSQNNTADAGVYRVWKKGLAPANQDWEARVQVELPNLAFATNGYVGAGLMVLNAADPGDRLNLEIETGKDNGFAYRDFYVTHTQDDVDQLGQDTFAPATNTVGLLRARWLAASGVLLMEYDPDGPANGENWVTLRSFSPSTNWGINSSGAFLVGIGAYARNRTVSASEGVVLDSFATSITPLPDIAWLPSQSTRDGVPFQALGTVFAAPPGATNPVGLGLSASGTYRFGFFNRLPANPTAPTVAEADLTGSPLAAGTQLVLKFSKRTNDHVSFVAMTADASVLSDVGYAVNPSGNELTVRARVVNPVASESNNPDTVGAAFGLLVRLAPTPTGPENFRGTVFVTDMLYHDVEPPGPGDAAQTSTNYIGQMVSLAAKGISASTATFHAFIPERLFAAGRANGVDVTGENCLGYRTYLQLTGSSNGFFKLNSPTTSAFTDANFDSDGDGSADAIWRYKIANSTWSRQVIGFGKAQNLGSSGLTYTFTTLAGVAGSFGSIDGTGSAARFYYPNCVALDSSGNLYVGENGNSTIRKVTPGGSVTTLAGLAGSSGSTNGTGSAARFNGPNGLAVDSAGNVYVADYGNHTIRKVTPGGSVTTLAGLAGSSGSADGTGSAARFRYPFNVAVDSAGIVYVSDTLNHTVRKVMPDGTVSTLAGSVGGAGNADGMGSAARFDHPNGLAVDRQGNIYVADYLNHTIRKVTPGGAVSTLAGLAGSSGSTDGTGNAARFSYPYGVALDSAGNVFVADEGNQTIRKVTPGGSVTTLAGLAGSQGSTDGPGSATRFSSPRGVAVDGAGNVYVADYSNMTIRKGVPTTSEPPVITGQPQGATLLLNQFTNFSVTATGSAPLAYQWFKFFGGAPVLLPGGTNSYYSILPTSRYPSGSYFVVVTNIHGSVTSSPALLRVLVPQRLLVPERLGDGRFRLRFGDQDGGLAGADDLGAFEVYATINVFDTNSWVRLTNGLSIVNGQVQIEDAGAPGLPRRFYRIIER